MSSLVYVLKKISYQIHSSQVDKREKTKKSIEKLFLLLLATTIIIILPFSTHLNYFWIISSYPNFIIINLIKIFIFIEKCFFLFLFFLHIARIMKVLMLFPLHLLLLFFPFLLLIIRLKTYLNDYLISFYFK